MLVILHNAATCRDFTEIRRCSEIQITSFFKLMKSDVSSSGNGLHTLLAAFTAPRLASNRDGPEKTRKRLMLLESWRISMLTTKAWYLERS